VINRRCYTPRSSGSLRAPGMLGVQTQDRTSRSRCRNTPDRHTKETSNLCGSGVTAVSSTDSSHPLSLTIRRLVSPCAVSHLLATLKSNSDNFHLDDGAPTSWRACLADRNTIYDVQHRPRLHGPAVLICSDSGVAARVCELGTSWN
jgi:hypothetical protein